MASKAYRKFTYADYVTWPDEERWELIDGNAYDMTPAPTTTHQSLVLSIARILMNAEPLSKSCKTLIAPVDVVLSEYDVVQPDVLVVCDRSKITEANIRGAPDLVIEVLSPSTGLKDRREKKRLYERYGVREYLLVYPSLKYVERFFLGDDGMYGKGDVFGAAETLSLLAFEGIRIELRDVFEEI